MITAAKFISTAQDLGIPVPRVKAVKQVESGGTGILDGKPVILFEPHIFWQQLEKRGISPYNYTLHQVDGKLQANPAYNDILYRKWGSKPYPSGQAARWIQLDKACTINRDAALASASWGLFQICGFNYRACGCETIQSFINANFESEDAQLELFEQYIRRNPAMWHALKIGDFATFARLYNGPLYKKNDYDGQLKRAEQKFL